MTFNPRKHPAAAALLCAGFVLLVAECCIFPVSPPTSDFRYNFWTAGRMIYRDIRSGVPLASVYAHHERAFILAGLCLAASFVVFTVVYWYLGQDRRCG